jgi:MarR family transcriptional regulator, organic hydroperoxide resistance regulator
MTCDKPPQIRARNCRPETMNDRSTGTTERADHLRRRKMLAVLAQFRVLFRSIREHYQRVERRSGVTGAQLWALAHVGGHPGTRMGDLARALAIHPSTASNLVRRLEALALVARRRTGSDQRTVQLHLTGKGALALRRAPQPLIGVLQQALSELPPRRLQALGHHLGDLIGVMKVKDLRASTMPISHMR